MFNENVFITIICRKDKKNQQNQAPLYFRLMFNKQRKLNDKGFGRKKP